MHHYFGLDAFPMSYLPYNSNNNGLGLANLYKLRNAYKGAREGAMLQTPLLGVFTACNGAATPDLASRCFGS